MEELKGKPTYRITHDPTGGEIEVTIDYSYVNTFGDRRYTMVEYIKEMAEFWADSKTRISDNDGDYVKSFLKQLCQEAMTAAYEKNLNITGVRAHFDDLEGYSKMDGSQGIHIIACEQMDLSNQEDYTVTEYPF